MRPRAQVDKLYYRIGEVAQLVGVEPHVLRYWETEFRSVRPQKSASGQRVYSRRDVDTLMRVKGLLYGQGFTIAGAKKKLREGGVEPQAPEVAATSESLLKIRAQLLDIREETAALLAALAPSR